MGAAAQEATSRGAGSGERLVEATVETERSEVTSMTEPAGLLIELPGGGRVRVESPMQLRLAAELLGLMAQGMNQNHSARSGSMPRRRQFSMMTVTTCLHPGRYTKSRNAERKATVGFVVHKLST